MTIDDFEDRRTAGLHALALVSTEGAPDPAWPGALDGLREALQAIHDGRVASNEPVHEHDIADVARVRAFVQDWIATGARPAGVDIAEQVYLNLTRGSPAMLETSAEHRTADGARRGVTLRIGDVRRECTGWSARVDLLGLGEPRTARALGDDWLGAIEAAARLLRAECASLPGTLDPEVLDVDDAAPT